MIFLGFFVGFVIGCGITVLLICAAIDQMADPGEINDVKF